MNYTQPLRSLILVSIALLAACGDSDSSGAEANSGGTPGTGGTRAVAGGAGGGSEAGPGVVQGTVTCELPLDIGQTAVGIELKATPQTLWTSGGSSDVGMGAQATIPASLGQLLIDTGSDVLNIESLTAEVSVSGGTPTAIVVEIDEPLVFDVDADDDGQAEDVPIAIPVPTETITNDGSPNVSFTIAAFEVALSDVAPPIIEDLLVSDDPAQSDLDCSLASTSASFSVN